MLNPSEWNNIITVLVALMGPMAVQDGISDSMLKNALTGIVAVGVALYALWSHWNMKKVPEKATVTSPVVKAVVLLMLGGATLTAFTHPTFAAGLSRPRGAVSVAAPAKIPADPLKVVQAFTISDLNAALADASTPITPLPTACSAGVFKAQDGTPCVSDPTAAACYAALIPYVQANVKNPLPTQLGAFLAFQKARDLKAVINGGIPSAINDACAPLVLDAANTIIGLGAKVGLGIALPAGLPFGL